MHKVITVDGKRFDSNQPSLQEQFVLGQYSRAIAKLQTRCCDNDRKSLRVALISCIVFVSLEFLQGHYRAATTHLKNGYRLLEELCSFRRKPQGTQSSLHFAPSDEWVEDCIEEAFCGMACKTALFNDPSAKILHGLSLPFRSCESIV